MPSHRNLALGLAVAIGATSLTLGGTVAGYASSPPSTVRSTASAVPSPQAPHVGQVAGVQRGSTISINNPTSVRAFRELHAQMRSGHRAAANPGLTGIHEYVGTSFKSNTLGSQATQSVSTKIKPANAGTTLYTPTMYPSGGSCIEMSTAYFHDSQVVAAWDWCKAITFVAQVDINKKFITTYTQHHNYSVQIVQTDAGSNTWTSYLYDYQKNTWEKFYSQSGTSQAGLSEGWDIYELYSDLKSNGQSYACDDLQGKRVEARAIKVGVNGKLVAATPSNAGHDYDVPLSDFHCSSLTYTMIKPYSHFKAIG